MIHHIVAKHIKRTLVEIVGSDYAVSVERDVVTALWIHE